MSIEKIERELREMSERDVTLGCNPLHAEIRALLDELSRLREALKPFSAIADEYDDQEDDDFQVWKDFDVLGATLPLKHFRAARRALSEREGQE